MRSTSPNQPWSRSPNGKLVEEDGRQVEDEPHAHHQSRVREYFTPEVFASVVYTVAVLATVAAVAISYAVYAHNKRASFLSASIALANGAMSNGNVLAGTDVAPFIVVPEPFAAYNVNAPLTKELLPESLLSKYSGPARGEPELSFHWVINSCNRHQWGRMFTTTLLSGLAADLRPATITILWCHPYNRTELPSLLYNMRHSHSINVMFMSPAMEAIPDITHMVKMVTTTLTVPEALGAPHLPLLWTEDDIMFAPDANARLHNALAKLPDNVRKEPLLITLYVPGDIKPAPTDGELIRQAVDDEGKADLSHSAAMGHAQRTYYFGSQAFYFSASMTALMAREMHKIVKKEVPQPHHLQDMLLMDMFAGKWKCNKPGSQCSYYMINPSLVQHIGTSSALFNNEQGLNSRFHYSQGFPVRVAFPGYEPSDKWRRRRQLRGVGV